MTIEHYITLAIIAGVGLWGLYSAFSSIKKARVIEDTPTSKIRSASQGYSELSGFAKSADGVILSSPLSSQPCLWYRYRIEHYQRSGKSSSWRTIESKTSHNILALDDATGVCYIYPNKADISSSWKKVWYGNTRKPIGQASTATRSFLSGRRYRYTEEYINQDDYLYALGMFQTTRAPSPEQQAKTAMADLLAQWKQDYDELLNRFDTNNDGQLDMQEWEAAREAALAQAKAQVDSDYSDKEVHILVQPPKNQPFIISNKDPKQLTKRYRWTAAGMSAVFVGASAFIVYFLQQIP